MRYRITHSTKYSYSQRVTLGHNELRLTPANSALQSVISSDLNITPTPTMLSNRIDFFGNTVHHFTISRPHREMKVEVISIVDRQASEDLPDSPISWEQCRDQLGSNILTDPADLDAKQFLYPSRLIEPDPAFAQYAATSFTPGRPLLAATHDLMHRIYTDFTYSSGSTTIATPISEVLQTKRGVCQDFAQVAIACLMSQGLPGRYVSGYLETLPPPGKQRLIGADASHAWFATYLPGHGWYDFDPTNDQRPGERHITVGWGRDFNDVSPLKGLMVGGANQQMEVSVDVAPLGG